MAVNSFITFNVRENLINIEVVSMQLSCSVLWSIFMVSMSFIGMSHLFPLNAFLNSFSDLKPENILLDYTGHIALCDFGKPLVQHR